MPKQHVRYDRSLRPAAVARVRTVLLAACLLIWSSPLYAATIALLRPSSDSPKVTEALFRLQGELLSVGLEVEITDPPPTFGSDTSTRKAWLEQLAAERGFDALVDVLGHPNPVGVDVWIYQSSTRSFRLSRVMLEPATPNAPETLAIRAIEVLRSNFLVIDLADDKAKTDFARQPPADTSPVPPARDHAVGVAAGAALLASLDNVGPAISPLLRIDWLFHSRLVATGTLSGFGTRPMVQAEGGSVKVAQTHAMLALRYLAPANSTLKGFGSLGVGASRTLLDGWGESPNQGHRVDQWALLLEAGLGAQLELSERFYLGLGVQAQFAQPYVAIHFVDTKVATTGRPNLLTSLTLGAWL